MFCPAAMCAHTQPRSVLSLSAIWLPLFFFRAALAPRVLLLPPGPTEGVGLSSICYALADASEDASGELASHEYYEPMGANEPSSLSRSTAFWRWTPLLSLGVASAHVSSICSLLRSTRNEACPMLSIFAIQFHRLCRTKVSLL